MPFRLHKHNSCLSFSFVDKSPTLSLWNSTCTNSHSLGFMNAIYSWDQMWYFFPTLKATQQLQVYVDEDRWRTQALCLTSTAGGEGGGIANASNNPKRRRLKIADCTIKRSHRRWTNPTTVGDAEMEQQFIVKTRHRSEWNGVYNVQHEEEKGSYITPGHLFSRGQETGHGAGHGQGHGGQHNPPTMVVSIAQVLRSEDEWALSAWQRDHGRSGNPQDFSKTSLLCMAFYDPPVTLTQEATARNDATLNDHQISMEPCDATTARQILVLERTTISAWLKHVRVQIEKQHYDKIVLAS